MWGSEADYENYDDENPSSLWRTLAKKTFEEPERSDYSILAVSVMTLGLILMIELARHKLDHYAQHRPFLNAVLHDVYSELSTLGLVELCIWILLTYWETINIPKEKVFAKVHFTLFYTAVFNAFQTVVIAVASMHVSRRLWVQTETLELNHYVEIREEFQHVQAQLDALHEKNSKNKTTTTKPTTTDYEFNSSRDEDLHVDSEDAIHFNRKFLEGLWDRVRYPRLKARYNRLLMQVRFHELRVHFLEAYELPAKFKVSDYLIRSETQVLISLVQVSTYAWLLLTAAVNLLYFCMGIVTWQTESPKAVGTALTWVFFSCMCIFVVVTWLVYNKMKWIFHEIMHDPSLWRVDNSKDNDITETVRDDLAIKQRDLFWGGNPNLVVAAVQFMQFGYAIALAVVLIFWDTIAKGDVKIYWFLVGIFGCYSVFVIVAAQLVPRYTLCTSLGQLVNRPRLQEAAALYHLEDEKQRRLEMQVSINIDALGASLKSYRRVPKSKVSLNDHAGTHLADLVKSDTESLRSTLPDLDSQGEQMLGMPSSLIRTRHDASTRRLRRDRRKAMSEGVATMASMRDKTAPRAMDDSDLNASNGRITWLQDGDPMGSLSERSRRVKSTSDGVSAMTADDASPGIDLTDLKPIEVHLSGHPNDDEDSDYHSDIDDVPDAPVHPKYSLDDKKPPIEEQLRDYYLSSSYWSMSHVFGTMFAFFMVGQRVERFLHTDGVVGDDFVSYDFDGPITFWSFTCWLIMFFANDVTLLLVFRKEEGYKDATLKVRKLAIAACLDICLVSACLAIFFAAEAERCCIPDESYIDPTDDAFAPAACACQAFGYRLFGGLGTTEPWVAIIALRIFRGRIAKHLEPVVDQVFFQSNQVFDNKRSNTTNHGQVDPFDIFGDEDHHHHHGHGDHRPAIELWQAAIGAHPEIVNKYGEFSGELLQVMLGLQVSSDTSSSNSMSSAPTKTRTISEKAFGTASRKPLSLPAPIPEVPAEGDKIFSVGKEFRNLAVDAQQIIVAGKLGRNVRPILSNDLGPGAVIPEEDSCASGSAGTSAAGHAKFELNPVATTPTNSVFVSPNARLIRSMRRCGRKLLPMLDTWTAVDVVMTRYEVVYFEVPDESNFDWDPVHQALAATHGGKGLRLCDVAAGRQVAGHLLISDIRSVHVEREVGGSATKDQDDQHCGDDTHVEFWLHAKLSMEHAWCTSEEDRLKIDITGGRTLFLRFYTDLVDARNAPVAKEADTILKNNAFQWVQSLGRICGSGNLHQQLPHFGFGDEEELRDYLIVHHHGEGETRIQKFGHRFSVIKRATSHGRATSSGSDNPPSKSNLVDDTADAAGHSTPDESEKGAITGHNAV